MVKEHHRALHQFVMERAGDSYRTAFYYDEDGWETLHVRENVATEELERSVPKAVERARNKRAFLRGEEYPPLGQTTATTEVHENGVILHFPENSHEGVSHSTVMQHEDWQHLLTMLSRFSKLIPHNINPNP